MKSTQLSITIAALCFAASAAAAAAADPKLGIVYDAGGKFDKSFNQSAFEGASRFRAETKIGFIEVQASSDTQAEQVLRGLARKKLDLIAAIGFSQTQAVQKVAAEFPNVKFVLIDSVAQGPNVNSVLFKEEEGSYLVGVAASMASKTKKLGFVGGMGIPLIRRFGCGYAQGVMAANPAAKVILNMTGTDGSAWNNPVKGAEIAKSQQSQGADVIYAAAGATGVGVLQAAADMGILSIGVDSNQNYLHPGQVLTSMMKRVDNAVHDAFAEGADLKPGVNVMDLKAGGVDFALDDNNAKLVTPEMKAAVDAAAQKIKSGALVVHDYMTDNTCPGVSF
ncbi:MAG: BMP family ABC transporter substrate-binding protein [Pseudorhodobacter sp.]|nr:BMP family ABC transporter substrate-binding protein [Pseudorhodobacter sp.]